MPAYDLQDRARSRPVELGRIRLGTREPNQKGDGDHPAETPWFVLHDAPQVEAAYPKQPTELLVYLPFATVEQNLVVWHMQYSGTVCHCKGDGRQIVTLWDDANIRKIVEGYVPPMACPGMKHDLYERCKTCAPVSKLFVIVRDPADPKQPVGARWGYYLISTRSSTNYDNLSGNLMDAAEGAAAMNKSLARLPMILRRVEKTGSHVDAAKGQRMKDTHYPMQLELDMAFVQSAARVIYDMALAAGEPAVEPAPALPMPKTLDEQGRSVDFMTGEILDEEPEPEPERPTLPQAETLPFPPGQVMNTFGRADWTAFWPFVAKRYGKKPSQVNAWVHHVVGVKSMTACDWSFEAVIHVLDQDAAAPAS